MSDQYPNLRPFLDENDEYKPREIECPRLFYAQLAEMLEPHERSSPDGGGLILYSPNGVKLTFKAGPK